MKKCKIEGCDGKFLAKGMCKLHYGRARDGLDPSARTQREKPPEERLRERLVTNPHNGCMEWAGYKNAGGYGKILVNGDAINTHRYSWELANGPIPDGMYVLHKCDNRPCCNPDHLFLGTHADNMADMDAKGRRKNVRGERNGMAKLRNSDVTEIRRRLASGESCASIARDFKVRRTTVSRVKLGQAWL